MAHIFVGERMWAGEYVLAVHYEAPGSEPFALLLAGGVRFCSPKPRRNRLYRDGLDFRMSSSTPKLLMLKVDSSAVSPNSLLKHCMASLLMAASRAPIGDWRGSFGGQTDDFELEVD